MQRDEGAQGDARDGHVRRTTVHVSDQEQPDDVVRCIACPEPATVHQYDEDYCDACAETANECGTCGGSRGGPDAALRCPACTGGLRRIRQRREAPED